MTSNKKLFNCEILDRVEGYNFDKSLSSFETIWESYELFFNIEFLDHPVLTQMRLKNKYRDRDDTTG